MLLMERLGEADGIKKEASPSPLSISLFPSCVKSIKFEVIRDHWYCSVDLTLNQKKPDG